MFEKIGNAWVRRLKACVAAKGGSFERRRIVPLGTQRKNTSLTRRLTPWHSPQTPTASQRQTTRGKTLLFCDASRTNNFEPPEPQNGPGGPKNPDFRALRLIFFFNDVSQMVDGR